MKEDQFEWDAGKAESNLAKHGVSFAAARSVFDDALGQRDCSDSGLYGAGRAHTDHLNQKSDEA